MAKHLPDYHSPLWALGKKVLLWIMLPAALVLAAFYSMATDTSDGPSSSAARDESKQGNQRVMQDYEQKRRDTYYAREQGNRGATQDYEQKRRDAYSTADDIVRRAQRGGK